MGGTWQWVTSQPHAQHNRRMPGPTGPYPSSAALASTRTAGGVTLRFGGGRRDVELQGLSRTLLLLPSPHSLHFTLSRAWLGYQVLHNLTGLGLSPRYGGAGRRCGWVAAGLLRPPLLLHSNRHLTCLLNCHSSKKKQKNCACQAQRQVKKPWDVPAVQA